MYISPRAARVRNSLVSLFNGGITLILLLIAPLGLAAVIVNTLLIMSLSYIIASLADRVIVWLLPVSQTELFSEISSQSGSLRRQRQQSNVDHSPHWYQ
ncbi:CRISPR-associated protein Csx18 [Coleofasciculus sp.]|uniref:CRISPR-associated protein Csx18 n=1 Tax=Coleofasciculus sp. TaxID=3100458 RepID=UPI003A4B4983